MKERVITILCDGEYPSAKASLSALEESTKKGNILIACDGAITKLVKHSLMPTYIVGDMDTLSASNQKRYAPLIHKNPSVETNDQTKSFEFALDLIKEERAKGAKESYAIRILGATGKREDHTIGNIALLADYAEMIADMPNVTVCTITDYGTFIPILGSTCLKGERGDRISIFAFDNTLRIKSEGLLYKTDKVRFDLWWKATLNEFSENRAKLLFNHPAKALLYFPTRR